MDILSCIEKIAFASNIAVCLGVLIALVSVVIAIKSFLADHKRRKRQATFEFYHSIYREFVESLNKINEKFPNDAIISIVKIKEFNQLFYAAEGYLSCMERFAVGINKNIFDIHVFKRTVGAKYTIRWYKKLKEIIDYFRDDFDDNNLYKDLDKLVSKLEGKKNCKCVIFRKCKRSE